MNALDGIRVLDFTHIYAGPFATYQLGVMGAEIIKIEPPHNPDAMRSKGVDGGQNEIGLGSTYVFNNQGKKAITLNLKTPQGLQIAKELVVTADVLVENYSAGLTDLGLGPEITKAINPRLIYCEMSGFGRGHYYSGRPAYDPVIQAFSGMMSLNGEADQDYIRVGPPLIDYGTGAQTAFAIAAALLQRHKTGKGQLIEVNMLDAAMLMMSPHIANTMQAGFTEERSGNVSKSLPGYSVFPTKDHNLMVGAFTLVQHTNLFKALSLEYANLPTKKINAKFLAKNNAVIRQEISDVLQHQTAEHWEEYLNQNDIPAARIRNVYEMLDNDQPRRASSSRHKRFHGSDMEMPIAAFTYAEDGPELDYRCAKQGEDTLTVLTELGYSESDMIDLEKLGVI